MSALERLSGRRILFLNWRDLSNPAAGGAESYAEEIASRFSRVGAEVTLFTSSYDGAAAYDWAKHYIVIRRGGRYGVYLAAARHLQRHGHIYDAIVDFQHGIPFLSPLWAPDKPVVRVVHHVHQAQFDLYFPPPLNLAARLLEGRISRRVYRGRSLVAVSPSTLAEMRRQLGIRQQIYLVPNGVAPLPPPAGALEQLADHGRRQATATECRKWAQRFSWGASAERLASVVLSEMGRAARGTTSRRRANQLAAVAWWPPAEGREIADIVRKALRITDMITLSDDGLSVLLLGCDELAASRALERIPIPPAQLRLATSTELLCGVAGKRSR
jgi:Glycosyltransferase Family 4